MPLESQTLSINAKHYSGPDARFITAPVDIYEIDVFLFFLIFKFI